MPGPIRAYVRIMDRLADWVGLIAMYLIFVMIGVLLLDAITRNVIHIPLHWCVEFAQFTLAAYYFMGGALTLKNDDHVRMDLIYSHLSPRGRDRMDLVTVGCLFFYLCVMLGFRGELRDRTERLQAWIAGARHRLGRVREKTWPYAPQIQSPGHVPPLQGREKLRRMMLAGWVTLLLLAPFAAFFLVHKLGQ